MSYLALNPSPFDESFVNNNNNDGNIEQKRIQRNSNNKSSTLKKKVNVNPNVESMLNKIHNNHNNQQMEQINDYESHVSVDNVGGDMGNFSPPPLAQSTTPLKKTVTINTNENKDDLINNNNDMPITKENFDNLPHSYSNDLYNQYVPYYKQVNQGTSVGNKDQLLEKLNYMIHLLEEQKDEKTGHIMEELILYSFLGIFMIFIVDSFARAGKYVR